MKAENSFEDEDKSIKTRRIVIIDDDTDFAGSLQILLKNKNYYTQVCNNKQDAQNLIRENPFHIALVDLRLGDDNGVEVVSELKKIQPDINCIMITGYGSIETAVQALKKGAYDYLRKPINPDEMLSLVDRCFEKIELQIKKNEVEKALIDRDQQIQAIFEQEAIGIGHVSLEGNWIMHNKKICQILGLKPSDLSDSSVFNIIGKYDYDEFRKFLNLVKISENQNLNSSTEFQIKSDSEIPIWCKITASYVPGQDPENSYFILFFEDITQKKNMEEDRQILISNLADANRNLEDFTRTASHDLQEPLRKIISFTDRLSDLLEGKLNDKEKDYFQRLVKSTDKMRDLIDGLLQYSRYSHLVPQLVDVDLNGIIENVTANLEVSFKRSKCSIEYKDLPVVRSDPKQMEQLFQNLIGNSIKFKKDSESPVIKISCHQDEQDFLNIVFQDNGIGIDKKYFDRIFLPFERLHGNSEIPGTGMGLTICKKIVQRHKGEMTIASEKGKGTQFTIRIPIKQDSFR